MGIPPKELMGNFPGISSRHRYGRKKHLEGLIKERQGTEGGGEVGSSDEARSEGI